MLTEGCVCVCVCVGWWWCLRVGSHLSWETGLEMATVLGSSAWLSTGPFSKSVCFLREESFHLPPGVEVGGLEQCRILAAGGLKTEQPGDGALLS